MTQVNKEIIKAFQDGLITMERMAALTEEANLRKWVIGQASAMDAEELAKVIDFIRKGMALPETGE
jgi:hypothetical protein